MEAAHNPDEVVEFNEENLSLKLSKFIEDTEGGIEYLQIITDFDYTLTRDNVDGVHGSSTFNAIRTSPFVTEEFVKYTGEMDTKYRPFEKAIVVENEEETDLGAVIKLTRQQKHNYCEEWFKINYDRLCEEKLTLQNFRTIAETCGVRLRNGFNAFFNLKRELEVPMLVVSGGIGDVAKACIEVNIESSGYSLEDMKPFNIVSNLGEFEDDILVKFSSPYVHTMNKSGHVKKFVDLQQNLDEESHHHLRGNIIVMGDVIEDLEMVKEIKYENILKIGFLNNMSTDAHLYEKFQEVFDIIIHKDGNLWPVISIIELVAGRKVSNKDKLTPEFLSFIEKFE